MQNSKLFRGAIAFAAVAAASLFTTPASANPFNLFSFSFGDASVAPPVMAYAPESRGGADSSSTDARFRRQMVEYRTNEPAGTIVIDTPNTYLYYVLGNGRAMRYGIGVGREGFTWSGTQH